MINENTKAVIPVDIAGVMVDYDRIRSIVESKKSIFKPKSKLQEAIGHVLILADGAHSYGAVRQGMSARNKERNIKFVARSLLYHGVGILSSEVEPSPVVTDNFKVPLSAASAADTVNAPAVPEIAIVVASNNAVTLFFICLISFSLMFAFLNFFLVFIWSEYINFEIFFQSH